MLSLHLALHQHFSPKEKMFRVSKLVINIVIFMPGDFNLAGFHISSRSIEISPKILVQLSSYTKQHCFIKISFLLKIKHRLNVILSPIIYLILLKNSRQKLKISFKIMKKSNFCGIFSIN
jgi:hypothetical protein